MAEVLAVDVSAAAAGVAAGGVAGSSHSSRQTDWLGPDVVLVVEGEMNVEGAGIVFAPVVEFVSADELPFSLFARFVTMFPLVALVVVPLVGVVLRQP